MRVVGHLATAVVALGTVVFVCSSRGHYRTSAATCAYRACDLVVGCT